MIRKLVLLPAIVAPAPPVLIVIGDVITGRPFAPSPGTTLLAVVSE